MIIVGIDIGTRNFAWLELTCNNYQAKVTCAQVIDFKESSKNIHNILLKFRDFAVTRNPDVIVIEQQSPSATINYAIAHGVLGWAIAKKIESYFSSSRQKFVAFKNILNTPGRMTYTQRKKHAVFLMHALCRYYEMPQSLVRMKAHKTKLDDIADAFIYAMKHCFEHRLLRRPKSIFIE